MGGSRRKGELTKGQIDRGWLHQVAVHESVIAGGNYVTVQGDSRLYSYAHGQDHALECERRARAHADALGIRGTRRREPTRPKHMHARAETTDKMLTFSD